MEKVVIINGPNLNLLGRRNPKIYGSETFEQTLEKLRNSFPDVEIEYFQSNCEGEIIDKLHTVGFDSAIKGVVMNPGAYAHYSYAISDAVEAISRPVIEVHISDIKQREDFRHQSVTARCATAMIAGAGRDGYRMAIEQLLAL